MKNNDSPPRRHLTSLWVHYRLTDQMGVVYYANYLEFFEMGRAALIRDNGLRYQEMEDDGFHLPVMRAEVDYRAPARYEDHLTIHTWIDSISRLRIDFRYEIMKHEGEAVLCRGLTRHIIVGPEGRPRRLDAKWFDALSALQ